MYKECLATTSQEGVPTSSNGTTSNLRKRKYAGSYENLSLTEDDMFVESVIESGRTLPTDQKRRFQQEVLQEAKKIRAMTQNQDTDSNEDLSQNDDFMFLWSFDNQVGTLQPNQKKRFLLEILQEIQKILAMRNNNDTGPNEDISQNDDYIFHESGKETFESLQPNQHQPEIRQEVKEILATPNKNDTDPDEDLSQNKDYMFCWSFKEIVDTLTHCQQKRFELEILQELKKMYKVVSSEPINSSHL